MSTDSDHQQRRQRLLRLLLDDASASLQKHDNIKVSSDYCAWEQVVFHLTRAFTDAHPDKADRAASALVFIATNITEDRQTMLREIGEWLRGVCGRSQQLRDYARKQLAQLFVDGTNN